MASATSRGCSDQTYRPISNLPFISKVLREVAVTQLLDHLQRNSFRAHHSRDTALVQVTNDLLIASNNGLLSILV